MTNVFYNVRDVYTDKFYQLPQWLFTDSRFADMKNDTKVAYALLKDRNSLSVAKNLYDENGNIFFIYTNNELKDMLHVSNSTVSRVKKELIEHNLLLVKKMGFNKKTQQNLPSRMYLLKPNFDMDQIALKMAEFDQKSASALEQSGNVKNGVSSQSTSALEQSGDVKNGVSSQSTSALEQSGDVKNGCPEKGASALQPSGSVKNGVYLDSILEDTKKIHKDTQLDFSSKNYSQAEIDSQNTDLVHNASEYLTSTDSPDHFVLDKEAVELLSKWTRTPSQMHRVVQIILNAKHSAIEQLEADGITNANYLLHISGNKQLGEQEIQILDELGIDHNHLQSAVTNTLRKVLNALRKKDDNGTNFNTENYLFGSFKQMFVTFAQERLEDIDARKNAEMQSLAEAEEKKRSKLLSDPKLADFVTFLD